MAIEHGAVRGRPARDAPMPPWLARRASEELDWGVEFLRGRAPLGPAATRALAQAVGAAGRTDQGALAARAVRVTAAWPGLGSWSAKFDPDVLDRLAALVRIAGDLQASHGAGTTWRPETPGTGDADPAPAAPAAT
jgi:hypothetical protein